MALYRPFGAFRFGLALMVMLQHFQHLLAPSETAIFGCMGFGIMAVAVFFAVSGFVVAEANAVFYRGRPLAFMANRLLRLAPPYYAALALSMMVQLVLWRSGRLALWDYPAAGAPLTWYRVVGGLFGLLPALRALMPADAFEFIPFAWTLRLEMAFYLAVALALLAAARLGCRWVIPAAAAVAYLASVAVLVSGRHGILTTAPMFLTGLGIWLAGTGRGWACCVPLAVVLPAFWWGFVSLGQNPHPAHGAQFIVLAGLVALFAVLSVSPAPPSWRAIDRRLGDLSYPLYLNHYVVGIALTDLFAYRGVKLYVMGEVLSVALAAGMASLVDRPLIAMRNRLRRQAI